MVSCLLAVGFATPAEAQQTHLLVIVGSPGGEEYATKFKGWADAFVDAAKKKEQVPAGNITVLAGPQAAAPGVEKAFADIAAKAKPNETVVVLLIGHGGFDGRAATFSQPGRDLTVEEWGKLLDTLAAQRVSFVNTTASSGGFLPLAKPGRVVITATKTGAQKNEAIFAEHFVASFTDDGADKDHNGHVSIAEAFESAKAKVAQAYQQKGNMMTEAAQLNDGSEGKLAAAMYLGIGRAEVGFSVDMNDPEVKKLVEDRDALDRQIADLKLKKGAIPDAQYDEQMEKLLTDLAIKTKALRERQTKK